MPQESTRENFTFQETNLLCIYNGTGTRTGMIAAMEQFPNFEMETPDYGE